MSVALQDVFRGGCFGCGSENEHGLGIKSYWDGKVGTCHWTPEAHHIGGPKFVYGGIIASLIDCHAAATACYAAYDLEGVAYEDGRQGIFYVTGRLEIDYLRPTPIGCELRLEARKAFVACSVFAEGVECVRASCLFVRPRGLG